MASEPDRIVREIEILGLKQEAKEAAGGEMTTWEAEDMYISDTDHLSDRELYNWLWEEGLCEQTKRPKGSGWNWHTSPIGSGSEEDTLIHHRYFASEESRQSWMKSFPDYEMPPREKPPFDRDRFLPQAEYPVWDGDDDDENDDLPPSALN